MRRRAFIWASVALLVCPGPTRAQTKVPVIGLLWNDSIKPSPSVAFFLAGMRDRGYVLDRDFRIADRVTLDGYGGYEGNAAELVGARVNVIVASGTTATVAAAKVTKEIPIVAIMGVDPVERGLAASLSRPGGNVTGVASQTGDLTRKRIELLKALVPSLSRVGVLLAPNVVNPIIRRESEAAARTLKLQLHVVEAVQPADVDGRIAELALSRMEALYVAPSTMLAAHAARVASAVAKHRMPAVYANERYAEAGGLLVFSSSLRKNFVRVTGYVDRILKGARAGELPIEQSTDLELVVNLKTAKTLGIKVPQSILVRTDRMVE